MYLLLPDPELSERAGKAEIASAVQYLVGETHAQQRKVSLSLNGTHKGEPVGKPGLMDRRNMGYCSSLPPRLLGKMCESDNLQRVRCSS